MPTQTLSNADSLYNTMEKALYILAERQDNPPALGELASQCGLSEFHFQKQFTRWVGISPKRFSQFLSKEYIRALLDQGVKPMDAGYQAGLSGPGRLHELFISTQAMTPAQYRDLGRGLDIHYGIHDSPFGQYLLAITDKGICHLEFISGDGAAILDNFHADWALSARHRDDDSTAKIHKQLFSQHNRKSANLTLLLKGTNFQVQVWQALLKIPFGHLASYENLAELAGKPSATRASASAIARNRIAWLIPCHRVVRKIGETGQYRWGSTRKRIILGFEAATTQPDKAQHTAS